MDVIRKAGDIEPLLCIALPRNVYPLSVQERTVAALCREQLPEIWIIDRSTLDDTIDFYADRDAPDRQAMREIHRAVHRIDDPPHSRGIRVRVSLGGFLA